jgi:outer membrane protein assembly factor BamB
VEKGVIYIVDQNGAAAYTVPAKLDDTVSLEKRWSAHVPADRYYASPVVHEGLLYAMTQSGNMSVLDTATGAVVYQKQLSLGGTTYPSFCVAGGKIFASADTGKTIVLEPGRAYLEVAVNSFEPFRSTPVFSGSRIYIRGLQHLYCLGTPE